MNDTYLQALAGGALLGTGAILLMLTLGKIAGISGITFRAMTSAPGKAPWRWAFLLGLVTAPALTQGFGYGLPTSMELDPTIMAISGLLVGIGTKIGAGCTSGHGICGIGRLSARSITATLTFMLTALVTVAISGFFS